MEDRLRELEPSREIVAYCRGPYCVFADEAVALLRARGLTARRYAEGYPEWAAAGLPIEGISASALAEPTPRALAVPKLASGDPRHSGIHRATPGSPRP
jgi:hypothetical protein